MGWRVNPHIGVNKQFTGILTLFQSFLQYYIFKKYDAADTKNQAWKTEWVIFF